MTRAQHRHEAYVRRTQATRSLNDVHGLIRGFKCAAFCIGCAVAGLFLGYAINVFTTVVTR